MSSTADNGSLVKLENASSEHGPVLERATRFGLPSSLDSLYKRWFGASQLHGFRKVALSPQSDMGLYPT